MTDNNFQRKGTPIKSPYERRQQSLKSRSSSSHDLLSSFNTLDGPRSSPSQNSSDFIAKLPPSKSENPLIPKPKFPLKLEKLPLSFASNSQFPDLFKNSSSLNASNDFVGIRSVDLSSDTEVEDKMSNSKFNANESPKRLTRAINPSTFQRKPSSTQNFPSLKVSNIQYKHHILPPSYDSNTYKDFKLIFIPGNRIISLTAIINGNIAITHVPYSKINRLQFISDSKDTYSSDWTIDFIFCSLDALDLTSFIEYSDFTGDKSSSFEEYFSIYKTLRISLATNCGMSRDAIQNILLSIISSRDYFTFSKLRDTYGEFEQTQVKSSSPSNPSNRNSLGNNNTPSPSFKGVRVVPSMESLKSSESVRLKSTSVRSLRTIETTQTSSPHTYFDNTSRRYSRRIRESSPTTTLKKMRKSDPEAFTYVDPDFEGTESVKLFSFPEGEIDSVLVTSHELERLEPGIWLNDTLIDFELKYLKAQLDTNLQDKIHIFSSFFYRRLSSEKMTKTKDSESRTGYDLVKTWTRKVDIFAKDFVVVPINESLHWYLAIICHPKRMLLEGSFDPNGTTDSENAENGKAENGTEVNDTDSKLGGLLEISSEPESLSQKSIILDLDEEEEEEKDQKTRIFIFNSLGLASRGKNLPVINRLREYLKLEALDKFNLGTSKDHCTGHVVKVPQQENFTDCGCFLLQFVDEFFKAIPKNIETQIIDRANDLSDWFDPELAQNRRIIMEKRVKKLARDFTEREALKPKEDEKAEHEDRSSDIEEILL